MAATIVAVGALLVHAAFCVFTEKRPFAIGFVNSLLAGVILYMSLSMRAGQLVVATEFGAILLRGTWTMWLFRAALVCLALVPGIAWHKIRKLNREWKSPWAATVLMGLLVGCWAATRVTMLDSTSPENLQIYGYDVWWPPLIVWLTICFTGSVLALTEAKPILTQVVTTGALVVPLASFALNFQDLPDPWGHTSYGYTYAGSGLLWLILERASFAVPILAVTYIAFQKDSKKARMAAMGIAALLSVGFAFLPNKARALIGLCPAALLFGVLLARFIELAQKIAGPTELQPAAGEQGLPALPAPEAALPAAPAPGRPAMQLRVWRDQVESALPDRLIPAIALSLTLPVMAACLIDFFSIGFLNRTFEFIVLLLAWLVFAERLAYNILDILGSIIKHGKLPPAILHKAQKTLTAFSATLKSGPEAVGKYFSEGGPWLKTVKALAIPILVIFVVTVGNEFLNYGHTVIRPFQWSGMEKKDDISKQVTDELINALGRLRSALSTDLIEAERKPSGEHPADARFLTAISENVDATVVKGDDLAVGGVKIPLSTFFGPLQNLVRGLLGIRTIGGSIDESSDGKRYVINANASDGTSWRRVTEPKPELKTDAPKAAPKAGDSTADAAAAARATSCVSRDNELHDPIDDTIEKLAFDIASSDASYQAAGLTRNWAAFSEFRSGLTFWDCYDAGRKTEDLESAINSFRAAVELDQHFALAYYRLGTALQERQEPGAAVEAFRTSIAVNPSFIRGALVEATTLYNYQTYYPWRPAIAPPPQPVWERRDEALKIWTSLVDLPASSVSLSELLSAYAGICQYNYDWFTEMPGAAEDDGVGKVFYIPYFYCSAAALLAARIPEADRDSQERQQESTVLSTIGSSLDVHRGREHTFEKERLPWFCNPNLAESELNADGSLPRFYLAGSERTRWSLDYYRRSLALVSDDPAVRCNLATARLYLTENTKEMSPLSRDAAVHLNLAFALAEKGDREAYREDTRSEDQLRIVSGYYHRAQAEFDAATSLDPRLTDALTGFPFMVWQWQLLRLDGRAATGPSREAALRAEQAAREAIRLTEGEKKGDTRWMATASLAEILLAQGRFREAEKTIQKMNLAGNDIKNWPGLNEARWDLAQVYLCQSQETKAGAERSRLLRGAVNLYGQIRESEQSQEHRPFSRLGQALHPLARQQACPSSPTADSNQQWSYTMAAPVYAPAPACAWSGVFTEVRPSEKATDNLKVHVWGGGTDEVTPVSVKTPHTIALRDPEATGNDYYFAQLVDAAGNPVSAVASFETFAAPKSGACSKNLVKLRFDPVAPGNKKPTRNR